MLIVVNKLLIGSATCVMFTYIGMHLVRQSSARSLVTQITIEMQLCFVESTEELLETANCR